MVIFKGKKLYADTSALRALRVKFVVMAPTQAALFKGLGAIVRACSEVPLFPHSLKESFSR